MHHIQQMVKQYDLQLEGTSLILLPTKLVWWPAEMTLLLADSHFGKASTFRKAGVPVPKGTTAKMLNHLSEQINLVAARTLIVLGDLVHSNVQANEDFEDDILKWREQCTGVEVVLVKGNHDRRSASFYKRLRIDVPKERSISRGPFELCHDPTHSTGLKYSLCGHLHPAVRVLDRKLHCYWMRKNQLILPAFGEFTGTTEILVAENETAFAICEGSLILMSARAQNV